MPSCLPRIILFLAVTVFAPIAAAQTDTTSPFVTSPPLVVERMLALAGVTPKDFVVDLGSGDGRIVIAAAKRYGAQAMGVEYDPKLVALSRKNAIAQGVGDRTRFVEGDLFKVDLSGASVITVYLLPDVNRKLREKLLAELKPGARLVAHDFDMESWRPDQTESIYAPQKNNGRGGTSRIMLWIIPAQARGDWRLESEGLPAGGAELSIYQNFQAIEGEMAMGEKRVALSEPRLRGTEIRFDVPAASGPLQFVGRIDGNEIVGTVRGGTHEWPWRAARAR
ncbi:MAG: class I SAM-dependent methyltransferase [Betaproteobacteria bacterium]|nr:class I SAM-dependent methyltransferase [Betaproteobacteria bacterium]